MMGKQESIPGKQYEGTQGASNSHSSTNLERDMALSTKTNQVKIKSDCDAFHQLWKANPNQVPTLTPTYIQNCQVHEGEVGNLGCCLVWNYFHDGKDRVGKTITTDFNEGKKSVTFKVVEGDLMDLYKTFVIHIQVDKDGSDNIVTWTVEYEKLNPNVPDPDTLMEFYEKVTRDIEACQLPN
ncbi:unnamed protein product [Lactuca saligna]|uniref:Bet v I/Major latex protein domain-containing protein n=1 Tax=Lactuca saligna TaxID=75948 RepID=A0AA35YLB0_LACSI|nr:unnamed protein product [Lactuca saligna]